MQDNNHALIMQFARGTETLTLFAKLSALADSYDERREAIVNTYDLQLSRLYKDYYGQVEQAIRETRNRLADLQANDDGYHEAAEIED